MLYHLLYPLHEYVSWLNVFRYQTFRAAVAFLISFLLVVILMPAFIRWMRRLGGQPIRNDGPQSHAAKQGTPTMGGLVMVFAVTITTLLIADLTNHFVWLCLFVFLSLGLLGFIDDYSKIKKQHSAGISGPMKLVWQASVALIFAAILVWGVDFNTDLVFPFFKNLRPELGLLFLPFVLLVVVGSSNAVNLTDGLDGLAVGPIMSVALLYGIISYLAGHIQLSDYLAISYVTGSGELAVILAAVTAAGLGFLWYNAYPAQVFMGDVGALAFGGLLGAVAVIVKHELVLIVAGGIFVIEAGSVIIQRYYFKLTKKRFFRMAPIHHHFELLGWSEPKIIVRFWIVSVVLALISLTTLKLR